MCYQYWPGKRAQSYGEFRVELLSEENRGGFLLRAFSVQQAKVGMFMELIIADINFLQIVFIARHFSSAQCIKCGSSRFRSGSQTTSVLT